MGRVGRRPGPFSSAARKRTILGSVATVRGHCACDLFDGRPFCWGGSPYCRAALLLGRPLTAVWGRPPYSSMGAPAYTSLRIGAKPPYGVTPIHTWAALRVGWIRLLFPPIPLGRWSKSGTFLRCFLPKNENSYWACFFFLAYFSFAACSLAH